MTADKHTKQRARQLAEREGISYTAARRHLAEQAAPPPAFRTSAATLCPTGCDGTAHPDAACRQWTPADAKHIAGWKVREAAELPTRRAYSLTDRAIEARTGKSHPIVDHRWALALIYAMLTDQHPELRPDQVALRAAVEADDLAAVDAVMEPLDRAAVRLVTADPDQWWDVVKPRLDAYVAAIEADDRWPADWAEAERDHQVNRLTAQWHRAWQEHRGYDGYMERDGVPWWSLRYDLDVFLAARLGALAPGTRVRLADGRPAVVHAAQWAETGPPTGYRVLELVPGRYGNVGQLVPRIDGDGLLVPAGDCQPENLDGGTAPVHVRAPGVASPA